MLKLLIEVVGSHLKIFKKNQIAKFLIGSNLTKRKKYVSKTTEFGVEITKIPKINSNFWKFSNYQKHQIFWFLGEPVNMVKIGKLQNKQTTKNWPSKWPKIQFKKNWIPFKGKILISKWLKTAKLPNWVPKSPKPKLEWIGDCVERRFNGGRRSKGVGFCLFVHLIVNFVFHHLLVASFVQTVASLYHFLPSFLPSFLPDCSTSSLLSHSSHSLLPTSVRWHLPINSIIFKSVSKPSIG